MLTNLESINAVLIRQELPQSERLIKLNQIAITQMRSLLTNQTIKRLKQVLDETKRRIDTARDVLVGKVPDPKARIERLGEGDTFLCHC